MNVYEKEELPCFLYLIQIFDTRLGKPIPSVDPVVVTAASKNNSDENNSGKNSAKNAVPKINIVSMAKANDKNTLKTSNGQTEVRFFF